MFPVSVSLRVCSAGNGKRRDELIALGVPKNFSLVREFGQGRADGFRTDAAKFPQLLDGDWRLEFGERLTHPLNWSGCSVRLNNDSIHHR